MSKAWKAIDLDGGGLQNMNARYAQLARTRTRAYLAWLGFPLGLHRWYLREPFGAIALLVLTVLVLTTLGFGIPMVAAIPALAAVAFALFDLWWIDRRVVALNKELRIALFMKPGRRPPEGYRGRYPGAEGATSDDSGDTLERYKNIKERERGGHVRADEDAALRARDSKHVPSFNEQEAMLRAMRRKTGHKDRDKN